MLFFCHILLDLTLTLAMTGVGAIPSWCEPWAGQAVVYIENPSKPIEPPTVGQLKELWRISGYADRNEEVFGTIAQVLCDEESSEYVRDSQLHNLKKLSSDGEYLFQTGRDATSRGFAVRYQPFFFRVERWTFFAGRRSVYSPVGAYESGNT